VKTAVHMPRGMHTKAAGGEGISGKGLCQNRGLHAKYFSGLWMDSRYITQSGSSPERTVVGGVTSNNSNNSWLSSHWGFQST
jgi:hypothetical protein